MPMFECPYCGRFFRSPMTLDDHECDGEGTGDNRDPPSEDLEFDDRLAAGFRMIGGDEDE